MKAAFLTGQRKFEIKQTAEPLAPDDGLVLDVKACGICGSDLRRWNEGPPKGQAIIPGHEAAGVIIAVGKKTSDYAVGEQLAISPDVHCGKCYYCKRGLFNVCEDLRFVGITPGYPGGFAEKMVLTREILTNGIVHRMPKGLSFLHAALAEPCCSVLACHNRLATGLGDTIVVMGAGPIGCLHVAIAKARGARVIVSEPSETRRKMAMQFAPEAIVDPVHENLDGRVRQITDGIGADAVICANPVAQTQTEAVQMVRKRGRVVLFGGLPKANPMVTLDSNRIHYGEIEILGSFSYHPTMHQLALDLLSRGVIPADKLITHKFPLDDINEAYAAAAAGSALKVVVTAQ